MSDFTPITANLERIHALLPDGLILSVAEDTKTLILSDQRKRLSPLTTGFLTQKMRYFCQSLSSTQPLWRALGRPSQHKVCDLTAGFGRDSLSLAWLGAEVISVEKNPLLAEILAWNIQAFIQAYPEKTFAWQVVCADSLHWCQQSSTPASTIYYADPFFPHNSKQLPQNPMQWLQHISHENQDTADDFLIQARSKTQRLVIKIPKGPYPLSRPCQFMVKQKSSCYCIFMQTAI